MVKFQPSTLAMWVRFPLPALRRRKHSKSINLPFMKNALTSRIASISACMLMLAYTSVSSAQSAGDCSGISNDVRVAVEKDPSKVLMVVEDALIINEGCAADIVRAAIMASKADPALAAQIVQTAVSVVPKMAGVINDAAGSLVPGLAAVVSADETAGPVTVSGKNPGKNVLLNSPDPDEETTLDSPDPFGVPPSIRGVFIPGLPSSVPTRVVNDNPVSPSVATP